MAFLSVWAAVAAAALAVGEVPDGAPPQLKQVDKASIEQWSRTHLVQEDWSPTGWNENGVVFFVSSAPADMSRAPLVTDWVRSEFAKGDNQGARSSLIKVEADCVNNRSRNVESFYYGGNNLRGELLTSGFMPDAKFVVPADGSIHQTYLQTICRAAR